MIREKSTILFSGSRLDKLQQGPRRLRKPAEGQVGALQEAAEEATRAPLKDREGRRISNTL